MKRTEYIYNQDTKIFCAEVENTLTHRDTEFSPLPFSMVDDSGNPVKPEPPKGYIAKAADDLKSWEYKEDKSGVWYSIADKTKIELTENDYDHDVIGYTRKEPIDYTPACIFNGTEWVIDDSIKLDLQRTTQKDIIRAAYDYELNNSTTGIQSKTLGVIIDYRELDYNNTRKLTEVMELTGLASIPNYKVFNGTELTVTLAQLKSVCVEILLKHGELYEKKNALIKEINKATTLEQIEACKW